MTFFDAGRILGFIAVGFGAGVYGTLIGAGGGFVLMPILLLLYPHRNPEELTSISLAVVFFNALSGTESYALMKRIDYKSGLMFAIATIPGAIIGVLATSYVPRHLFNIIFGILALSLAAFLLLRHERKWEEVRTQYTHHHQIERHLVEADGASFDYAFSPLVGIGFSVFVGFLSGLLGIGGGIIYVPMLAYLLNFPVPIATATSQFILIIISLTGTLVHIETGTFSHNVNQILSLAIGVVLGANLGAHLSSHLPGKWIIRSLAAALGLVGIRIVVTSF